ncbi:MAG: methylated-DNA--[protein]-cysteine S-methyltransferase [Armatimonadetes bacterium]|nr:methylated-DNA--[protein]-cysteine S-methyltransferase [Armatimonadota bacterium]
MRHESQQSRTAQIVAGDAAFRVTLTPRGVSRLEFVAPAAAADPAHRPADPGALADVTARLAEYLQGRRRCPGIPVDLSACTGFQRRVLESCARVPAGQVITYAELARRVGQPGAARAVGGALARNPVPILVPCHRVARADGGLGGFIAGLDWKRRLLRLEGVET